MARSETGRVRSTRNPLSTSDPKIQHRLDINSELLVLRTLVGTTGATRGLLSRCDRTDSDNGTSRLYRLRSFTHHERSYDYSHSRRRIAGYEDKVPDDTDFIVIDTRHPYSDLKSPDQVRELKDHPDVWELLPDKTDGYFIVLRRSVHSPVK